MKALVIWSSRTGNTKAVGKAVYDSLDCEKEFVEAGRQPEDLSAYDIIFVGFWAYRRGADVPARKVLSSLRGKKWLSMVRQVPIPTRKPHKTI